MSTTAPIGLAREPPRGCSAGVAANLRAQVGRGVEQRPALPSAETARLACVRGVHARVAGPGEAADRAAAIPLRKAAAGRRTEHDGGQRPMPGGARIQYQEI